MEPAEQAAVTKTFTPFYWRYVPEEELAGRSREQREQAVRDHVQLARRRVVGELLVRVSTPDSQHSLVEIITDDMPFLVDSVTAELNRLGVNVRLFVHPQLVVRRDAVGELLELKSGNDPDEAARTDIVESWMHIEIDRLDDQQAMDALQNHLRRVLTDVREAVEDWEKMRNRALTIADELAQADLPVPDKDVNDARALLRWLADNHFTFLGYREYALVHRDDDGYLQAISGTGLGILRSDQAAPRSLTQMAPEVRAQLMEQRLLILTKANSRSTVHRPAYMDYIGLKTFDATGRVVGERRFLGLFSSSAYFESVRKLPVISRKAEEVIQRSGLSLRSFLGKDLLQVLETYPRDELFQIHTEDLLQTAMEVLRLTGRRQLRLFVRKDTYGRFVSCLVYLPRDRYTTRSRLAMQEILMDALHGVGVDYTARVTEGMLARVRFVVRTDPQATTGDVDVAALQAKLVEVTRLWEEDFADALTEQLEPDLARGLRIRYAEAFTEGYKAERSPAMAVADVRRIEGLTEQAPVAVHLDKWGRSDDDQLRLTIYQQGSEMSLSDVLPVLQSLGVRVLHERPYQLTPVGSAPVWIYDYGLHLAADTEGVLQLSTVGRVVEQAFIACWLGDSEVDGFNRLVLAAGLTWQQVSVLRAYGKYLRQASTRFSQAYMERTLAEHPHIAGALINLFDARFNPSYEASYAGEAEQACRQLVAQIHTALDSVTSLDQDRIIRSFLAVVQATLRTNYYQRTADGQRKQYLSIKLDPQAIDVLPLPRPKFEIFVYSPRVEGVHLRFGYVARGGLRWSDRHEDFRTEVLGLVKAQMVKNAIIVPVGSKGGFIVKEGVKEGIACYRMFISGLLDITDNLVAGKIVPPVDVVRHDGDDAYLVVAADKGTSTFSDIANEVAASYNFWLGDAFASGGSVGYDHKKMGITARGAWESVKRHFRQFGVDTQSQDFTVVGIGDMSGDVFGNGMLLSRHIRLVAAFDHRHVFVDPEPDAAQSFVERQRLFELPGSSWDSYDRALISPGGGVWPRNAKSIPISPQLRQALGLAGDITELSPAELIRGILVAPVDLLWNGGIGTYVKASTESNADVGDKSNDALRVDGRDLRCKVVGEGGNLGLTQLGRIEFARAGGHINTDAIDNSAGVDTSDHEVNIKILCGQAIEAGELTVPQRNELLVDMTDEVAELVLRNNYGQNSALMLGSYLAPKLFSVHRRLLTELEREGRLNRALEFLPSDDQCAEREAAAGGLTQPELSVLLAYVKIGLAEDLLASPLPDDPWCVEVLSSYFPTPMRERFAHFAELHPLRREIITTVVVNDMVNRGGVTFTYRAMEETGASAVDVTRAYVVVREVFNLGALWNVNEALDNVVAPKAQLAVMSRLRRVLDRGVRWLLQSRSGAIDVLGEIARLQPGLAELLPRVADLYVGQEAAAIRGYVTELTDVGVPPDLAEHVVAALHGFGLLDVVELAAKRQLAPLDVARVYFTVSERFRMDELLERVTQLPRHDRWTALARMAIRYDLYAVLAGITADVLDEIRPNEDGAITPALVAQWFDANKVRIARVQNTLSLLKEDAPADLATLSVLLRQMRSMVRTG